MQELNGRKQPSYAKHYPKFLMPPGGTWDSVTPVASGQIPNITQNSTEVEFKASATRTCDHPSPHSSSVLPELTLLGTCCTPGAGLSSFLAMNRWPLSELGFREEQPPSCTYKQCPCPQGEILLTCHSPWRSEGNAASGETEAQETIHLSQRPMDWDSPESPFSPSPISLHTLWLSLFIKPTVLIPSYYEFSPDAIEIRMMMVKILITAATTC